MRRLWWLRTPLVLAAAVATPLALAACDNDGPAESFGERVDRAGEQVRDTVDPPRGPMERTGREIDRAFD